ncbi:MAG: hypothetical protein AB1403_17395 [Candidatus Riflebacteria bacterium]
MIRTELSRRGAVVSLILACILTLLVISTAFLLNNLHRSLAVPVAAHLKADYQMESAIVMQMQKIRNDNKGDFRKINSSREISPGYLLMLSGEQLSEMVWQFNLTLNGPGFSRSLKAQASKNHPDRIIYQHN